MPAQRRTCSSEEGGSRLFHFFLVFFFDQPAEPRGHKSGIGASQEVTDAALDKSKRSHKRRWGKPRGHSCGVGRIQEVLEIVPTIASNIATNLLFN